MSRALKYEYYSTVRPRKVDWLWYPYIPYGKLTVVQGDPGEGKSTFMINIAALVTKGLPMPDGSILSAPQTVVYQCAEDDVSDTVKPRLEAAGADCNRIAYIVDNADLTMEDDRIARVLKETGARLLILDPIQAFLAQDGDMQSAGRMRSVLGKLAELASQFNCAIVLIGHLNKGNGGKSLYRGLGTIDIAAIARSVLLIGRCSSDRELRYMRPVKTSLAPEGLAFLFSLDDDGMHWHGAVPPEDVDDGLDGNGETRKDTAIRIIRELLSEGDCPSTKFLEELAFMGISRRAVFRVKKEANIETYKKGNAWFWRLADQATPAREGVIRQ